MFFKTFQTAGRVLHHVELRRSITVAHAGEADVSLISNHFVLLLVYRHCLKPQNLMKEKKVTHSQLFTCLKRSGYLLTCLLAFHLHLPLTLSFLPQLLPPSAPLRRVCLVFRFVAVTRHVCHQVYSSFTLLYRLPFCVLCVIDANTTCTQAQRVRLITNFSSYLLFFMSNQNVFVL